MPIDPLSTCINCLITECDFTEGWSVPRCELPADHPSPHQRTLPHSRHIITVKWAVEENKNNG